MNRLEPVYKTLVFEGGGICGLAYNGALRELQKSGRLAPIRTFAGSSAGAIYAAILACGAARQDIVQFLDDLMAEIDFPSLMDCSSYKLKVLYDVYKTYGICHGERLYKVISSAIERLTNASDITFQQVYERYGASLVITGTSLTKRKTIYFRRETHPDMPVVMAVRISTSIPIIFEPVHYAGDLWVDGGMLDNYPMRAFHRHENGRIIIPDDVLGLMLQCSAEVAGEYPPINSIMSYCSAVVDTLLHATQKTYVEPEDWGRTIKINTGDVSIIDFKLKPEDKKKLIDAGAAAVKKYFDTYTLPEFII